MEALPHPLIEKCVGVLLPPTVRESVLGDLSERYRSTWRYLREALSILPLMIASQIRRTSTLPAVGLEALILFGCMRGFDIAEAPRDVPFWARAALPTLVTMITLVLRDVYRASERWSMNRAVRDILAVVAVLTLCQGLAVGLARDGLISPAWVFPPRVLVVMSLAILPALFVIRLGIGLERDSRLDAPFGTLSATDLRADYARFRSRVRSRNLIEVGLYGIGALGAALFLSLAPSVRATFLHWAWPMGQILVSWYVLTAASARAMPEQITFAALVAFYAGEIQRQRRHVKVIWWWYLWPLCIGVGLPAFMRAAGNPSEIVRGFASCALVTGFVAWFVMARAQLLADEMDNLTHARECT